MPDFIFALNSSNWKTAKEIEIGVRISWVRTRFASLRIVSALKGTFWHWSELLGSPPLIRHEVDFARHLRGPPPFNFTLVLVFWYTADHSVAIDLTAHVSCTFQYFGRAFFWSHDFLLCQHFSAKVATQFSILWSHFSQILHSRFWPPWASTRQTTAGRRPTQRTTFPSEAPAVQMLRHSQAQCYFQPSPAEQGKKSLCWIRTRWRINKAERSLLSRHVTMSCRTPRSGLTPKGSARGPLGGPQWQHIHDSIRPSRLCRARPKTIASRNGGWGSGRVQ